jgi:biopolymer transport protein TolR
VVKVVRSSDINMMPMIDVLLVLLIIFMVITPLTPRGLEALIPQPPPPGPATDKRMTARWSSSSTRTRPWQLNTEPVSADRLGERLLDVFKTRAERVCFVKGDPDLEFQYVAKAIDIAKGAQMDKVGLMTAKMEAGE